MSDIFIIGHLYFAKKTIAQGYLLSKSY